MCRFAGDVQATPGGGAYGFVIAETGDVGATQGIPFNPTL
jgi:hypothetical protein